MRIGQFIKRSPKITKEGGRERGHAISCGKLSNWDHRQADFQDPSCRITCTCAVVQPVRHFRLMWDTGDGTKRAYPGKLQDETEGQLPLWTCRLKCLEKRSFISANWIRSTLHLPNCPNYSSEAALTDWPWPLSLPTLIYSECLNIPPNQHRSLCSLQFTDKSKSIHLFRRKRYRH